ncbi:MAG: pseudouridine synthase [Bacteroidia bacterium]
MAASFRYFLLYKPFGMLSQFTSEGTKLGMETLAAFPKNIYPLGRLDADSEGLLLLTDNGKLNHLLLDPKYAHERTYCAQVEGMVNEEALQQLRSGVKLNFDGKIYQTKPARARLLLPEPIFPERIPPIRFRAQIPTSWLELQLIEGKNRQVRKMTAAVGFPTLRLIRTAIKGLSLGDLKPGESMEMDQALFLKKIGF